MEKLHVEVGSIEYFRKHIKDLSSQNEEKACNKEDDEWMNAPTGPYQEMEKTCKRKDDGSPADLQQFTPEQIDEYCKEMEGLKIVEQIRPRIEWVERGVQIIRQLQEEIR